MPTIYTLIYHSKWGEDVSSYVEESQREAVYRSLCWPIAREEWTSDFGNWVKDESDTLKNLFESADYDEEIDLMAIPDPEWDQVQEIAARGERDWWELIEYVMEPDEFHAFLMKNWKLIPESTLIEINALSAHKNGAHV